MKIKILYILKITLLIVPLFCITQIIFSQGTDISSTTSTKLYVGLGLTTGQSDFGITGTNSISDVNTSKKGSFTGLLEIGYFFSENFGLSSGLGFCSISTSLTLKSYQNKYTTTDTESESYERRITGSDIKETQKIGFLRVPVILIMRLPVSRTTGIFIQPGINLAIPLTKSYSNSGIFSFDGYYPAYNVLLSNLPVYGFPNNKSIASDGKLQLKSLAIQASVSAGVDFFVAEKIQIAVAGSYEKTLSDISAYSTPDKFQLATDGIQLNSLLGGSTKTSIQSIGLLISLKYYLK
jgi:hypothetical protein